MENSILDNQDASYKGGSSNANPWPIAQKWGLIGAAVAVIIVLVNYLMGGLDAEAMITAIEDDNSMPSFLPATVLWIVGMGIYIFVYLSAVKEYREQLGGYISFGEAFKVSFFSVLFKLLAVGIFVFLFYQFVLPADFAEQMAELTEAITELYAPGRSTETGPSFFHSPLGAAVGQSGGTLIGGAILSLIAAAIGQKNRLS